PDARYRRNRAVRAHPPDAIVEVVIDEQVAQFIGRKIEREVKFRLRGGTAITGEAGLARGARHGEDRPWENRWLFSGLGRRAAQQRHQHGNAPQSEGYDRGHWFLLLCP